MNVAGTAEDEHGADAVVGGADVQRHHGPEREAARDEGQPGEPPRQLVEGGPRVVVLAAPAVVRALAPAHAAEVEAQDREPRRLQRLRRPEDDLEVHHPAVQRVGVAHHRRRHRGRRRVHEDGLEPPGGALEVEALVHEVDCMRGVAARAHAPWGSASARGGPRPQLRCARGRGVLVRLPDHLHRPERPGPTHGGLEQPPQGALRRTRRHRELVQAGQQTADAQLVPQRQGGHPDDAAALFRHPHQEVGVVDGLSERVGEGDRLRVVAHVLEQGRGRPRRPRATPVERARPSLSSCAPAATVVCLPCHE